MEEIYQGLIELAAASFPKSCATCGRTYPTLEAFIHETRPISRSSGLKGATEEDGSAIVELFRNCVCGSTLMDTCQDRRNQSDHGLRRRQKFEELLHRLLDKGCDETKVRDALLTFVRNNDVSDLEALGVRVRKSAS